MTASVHAKTRDRVTASLKRRHAAERRFRGLGLAAVVVALGALSVLFADIISKGYTAFRQTHIDITVFLDPAILDPTGAADQKELRRSDTQSVIRAAIRARFPDVSGRRDLRELYGMISQGAQFDLGNRLAADPGLLGQTLTIKVRSSDDIDMLIKGHISRDGPENTRRISDAQITWIDSLIDGGELSSPFNVAFFTAGDSRNPEMAGILGAVVGSLLAMGVTLALSFPLAVAAAIYLEEFSTDGRWARFVEVNINNLAAVPSIVFGLLGMAVFLNFFGMPRSAPLVGGMVLALMTLPTIIIAARVSLKAVPPSIREAALGVGASQVQTVFNHVLPLAMPGILTGTIIGMARALGETAPLLMIGMVAFIADIPGGLTDPATALPVQIFLWADAPERAFVERTAAATMVFLGFLVLMNAAAVVLRKRFEVRY
ncbi:MAG: phosphate ABC transporter permease PstA [Alphaproteobacteria bacterium]|jgi:phosphate transport system permease protein|nr:phosphate ABC transporter permease PstA [Alphaproteobacteria bacterium]